MRVLVTRPENAAARTARRLAELGHEPILMPLFKPRYLSALRHGIEGCSSLAFTSANAVRALENENTVARFEKRPVFAVGENTAHAAREAGFQDVRSAKGDGAKLAEFIAANGPADGIIAYIAGDPRSTAFEEALTGYGVRFETILAYHMEPVEYEKEDLKQVLERLPEVILLYSSQTARRFFELLSICRVKLSPQTRFLCLSANIASEVPAKYGTRVLAADAPKEEKILSLI